MKKKVKITIEATLDISESHPPDKWDWGNLLGLSPDEEIHSVVIEDIEDEK